MNVMNRKELKVHIDGNRLKIEWQVKLYKKLLLSCYFEKPFSSFQWQLRIYRLLEKKSPAVHRFGLKVFNVREPEGTLVVSGLVPEQTYFSELGVVLHGNRFFPVLRSEFIKTSANGPGQKSGIDVTDFETKKGLQKWRGIVSTYTLYNATPPEEYKG